MVSSYNAGDLTTAARRAKALVLTFPSHSMAWKALGTIAGLQGDMGQAAALLRRAVYICQFDFEAHMNLGTSLRDIGHIPQAILYHRNAVCLSPGNGKSLYNLGESLKELGFFSEARSIYDHAIASDEDIAEVHHSLATLLLLLGEFRTGLKLYERRWESAQLAPLRRQFIQPLWLGEAPLDGKTILIHAEQGLGDIIQFCRYLRMVRDLGARVIFEVRPALMALLSGLAGVDQLIAEGQPLPAFDYHCPLLSLPLAFKTEPASIPATIPYLRAQPERVARWRDRLGASGVKVGICWKGVKRRRSIPIACFRALSGIPELRLISLHKGAGEQDLQRLPTGMSVETLGAEFDNDGAFMDTAAVIRCCDLVVVNDSSVAHLAGALGVPTWIALPFVPDWRWMLGRTDSPWYPSVRLFRQSTVGDWHGVFDQMETSLRKMAK